MLTNRRA